MANININIPNKLSIFKNDIETIIQKDEEIIRKYLEKVIYKCDLSEFVKQELNKIFEDHGKKNPSTFYKWNIIFDFLINKMFWAEI